MLLLSRFINESIIIGDPDCLIEVKIVAVQGDRVRVGISAPLDIPVHRQEVYEAIQREKQK